MGRPPISHICLDLSKTYLKECPPSVSTANREFPLSNKQKDVVRLHYKLQITQLHRSLH